MAGPSLNDIRDRAMSFSRDWADAHSERGQAQPFLVDFFEVFGITYRRHAEFRRAGFESPRPLGPGRDGYIDLLWPGRLIIEMKSPGKSLDKAYAQVTRYFLGLKEFELPRYILVCDFRRFRLYDLESDDGYFEFSLADLYKHIERFMFIAGAPVRTPSAQDPVNVEAAERLGKLHDLLETSGYRGHALERFIVRVLFCLFAESTRLFDDQAFQYYIEDRTSSDGSDLGSRLHELFEVLDTDYPDRQATLDEELARFPYVNGQLYRERLAVPHFNRQMREQLLECCSLSWSEINPSIFGAMFQSIKDRVARRNLGEHYTSEENILKAIRPLFLDDLWDEFEKVRRSQRQLYDFHDKLRRLRFCDPACGCGNFLVIAYRELRKLELSVIRAYRGGEAQSVLNILRLDVDQFLGIEVLEWPARIAEVALWLMDHLMNLEAGVQFGQFFSRLPLRTSPQILIDNACTVDWRIALGHPGPDFIFGNPPFVGAKYMSPAQRGDMEHVFSGMPGSGLLDYVTCWYMLAARYIQGTETQCAFVSTNSITQGEQVGVLWDRLLEMGIYIHFAHRTFAWQNEARGMAAVHCVIVGFAARDAQEKEIFEYANPRAEPVPTHARNINPYLIDGPNLTIKRRSRPICDVPEIGIGNKPIDGGNYLFTESEKNAFLSREPQAAPYFRPWVGAEELINGHRRFCLWLGDCSPNQLRQMPEARRRVEAVKQYRLASRSLPTRALAATPREFHVKNMPEGDYLGIPGVSSVRREYLPIGFLRPEILSSNLLYIMPNANLFHFGVLSSALHTSWVANIGGRLKSDYRFSKEITYNNFPWPEPTAAQRRSIELAASKILAIRAQYKDATLADLYDPNDMPADLRRAHNALDRAVERAYGRDRPLATDSARLSTLLTAYLRITSDAAQLTEPGVGAPDTRRSP